MSLVNPTYFVFRMGICSITIALKAGKSLNTTFHLILKDVEEEKMTKWHIYSTLNIMLEHLAKE